MVTVQTGRIVTHRVEILTNEGGSDHCPVMIEIEEGSEIS